MFSASVSVSAHPFIGVFASTGMIIWAIIGLAGLASGMVTVLVSRRHNQRAKPAVDKTPLDTAAQPATCGNTGTIAANVTQAA